MSLVSSSRLEGSSSSLSGSYRSTLTSSSSLDNPYCRPRSGSYATSTLRSYGDTVTEYRSRYSIDSKGDKKSLIEYSRTSRAPSVTDSDSGISSRHRSDRSESRSRDISTTRSESGKTLSDAPSRTKRNFSSSAFMSTAELYKLYSPSNYIPLTQRIQQQQKLQNQNYGEISRSKSISNDIGRPPAADPSRALRKARNSAIGTTSERTESRRYKDSSPTSGYTKRNSLTNGVRDSNGNELPSVPEMRKKFDPKMAVTKLPANESRYASRSNDERYLNQLKDCENGTVGYTKLRPKDDKPVPVHLPYVSRNGTCKWESGSSSSRSNSNSDLSINKTASESGISKYLHDKPNSASTVLTSKIPPDHLTSVKSQLDPNNPIGKILEKSTVIQVQNGDVDYAERKRIRNSPETVNKSKDNIKNDIEKQVKSQRHTSDFASYIQISQPIASGTSALKKIENHVNEEPVPTETRKSRAGLKYIDSEQENVSLNNEIESPSETGFENKTFEHENYLKKRSEKSEGDSKEEDGAKSMETSVESTLSELTEDSSPETPSTRRKLLDKEYDDVKGELAGGKSGPSGLRRSTDRSESLSESRNERQSSHTSGLNGLRNIGNTCFMNSVLQCLSNTKPLLEYVSEDKYCDDINTSLSCMKGALIKAFATVIKEVWRSGERDGVVNTTALKSQVQKFAPRFMGYSQQDAQEFLRYLLEGLHEDVNRVTVKPKPILTEIDDNLSDSAKAAEAWSRYLRMEDSRVGDIFVGQLKSTLRCTHCNHDSVTFDPFWDLSLPIPARTGNLKLQQCLQHFVREEELDGDEKPTCSKCGVRRKCLKWFTVQKFPQVLVLHLKRFSPTERFRGKLSVVVEFPLSGLDMSPYAAARAGAPVYNLYAVSNHSGTTYSGHYTAYCKHPHTGDWHEYNDSRVTPISPSNVVSSEAYVLFYELSRT